MKMDIAKYFVEPENVLNELKKYTLVDGFDFVLDLNESQGFYFVDKRTGKKYLDFFSCIASMPIGINHPKLLEKDFLDYIGRVAVNKPSNPDVYTTVIATFVKTLFKIALPSEYKYSFFISGGALAVENALKAAFDWKVRKNFAKGYKSERGFKVIHFEEAFHGRSGYTMSLTNTDLNKVKYFPKFDWPRVVNPKIKFPLEENIEEVVELENQAIEQIKQAFRDNKDDIAAIVIEPIQGEGGDNHFRKEFLQKLRELTYENDALLIFDEIQSGAGITGKWWAFEHFGVVPDIFAFGKKMQTCGIASTDRIDEVKDNVFHLSSRINSTWGGNLVDMARSTKYMEIIDEENLIDNAAKMGDKLLDRIRNLERKFPNVIYNPRGRGLLCAFNMKSADLRKKFLDNCFQKGLFILPSGKASVRFRPPLNLTERQMSEAFDIIEEAMKEV